MLEPVEVGQVKKIAKKLSATGIIQWSFAGRNETTGMNTYRVWYKDINDLPQTVDVQFKDGISVKDADFVGNDMVFLMSDSSTIKILGAYTRLKGEGTAFVPKGEWQDSIEYKHEESSVDLVNYEGKVYAAMQNNLNKNPSTEPSYWMSFDVTGASGSNVLLSSGTVIKPTHIYNPTTFTLTIGDGTYRFNTAVDWSGNVIEFEVKGKSFVLTENTTHYIYADYNNGTPQLMSATDESVINTSDRPVVYTTSRVGNLMSGFSLIDWGDYAIGATNKSLERWIDAFRFQRVSGLGISVDSSKVVTITNGALWIGLQKKICTQLASNVNECFQRYLAGATWQRQPATAYNNTQYNDGTALITMTENYYGCVWVYTDAGANRIHLVQGRGQYADTNGAKAEKLPSDLEPFMQHDTLLLGRIVFKKGVAIPIEIDSAFETLFAPTVVSEHNSLAGLTGGNATTNVYDHLPIMQGDAEILAVNKTDNYVLCGGDRDDYVQLKAKNKNVGTKASADLVVEANNGTETTYYGDFGISNSAYSNVSTPLIGANTVFLQAKDTPLVVGTVTADKDVTFHVGGEALADVSLKLKASDKTVEVKKDLEVSGYTKLGSDAPSIKIKKFTGTMPSVGNSIYVAHGLTQSKIINYACIVIDSGGTIRIPGSATGSDVEYASRIRPEGTIWLTTGGSGTLIANQQYKFIIWYEE